VAQRLPEEVQGRLSYDDVRVLVTAHLDFLQDKGVLGKGSEEPVVMRPDGEGPEQDDSGEEASEDAHDLAQASDSVENDLPATEVPDEIVVIDDEALAFVLGEIDDEELDVRDDDAHQVLVALQQHLAEIGAIGPAA
jgi:hypothetical protein